MERRILVDMFHIPERPNARRAHGSACSLSPFLFGLCTIRGNAMHIRLEHSELYGCYLLR